MFMKHHHCCGHKAMRAALLGVAIFAIFAFGVGVGRHLGEGRNFNKGNFGQRGGSQMMRGYNNNMMQGQNGGRRFQGQVNQGQFQGQPEQIEVQAQPLIQAVPATTIQVVAPNQVKTVTHAK
jgi:hypothetical protein